MLPRKSLLFFSHNVDSIIFILITTKMSKVPYSGYRTDDGKLLNRNHSWVERGNGKFWTKQ